MFIQPLGWVFMLRIYYYYNFHYTYDYPRHDYLEQQDSVVLYLPWGFILSCHYPMFVASQLGFHAANISSLYHYYTRCKY
jgi:hypothetical protein